MRKEIEIKVPPDFIEDENYIKEALLGQLQIKFPDRMAFRLLRKSLDARSRHPYFLLRYEVFEDGKVPEETSIVNSIPNIDKSSKQVVVVGAGPAGYFAALELLERGIKPVVLERGKDVRSRRRDLRAIQQFGIVNPQSNYCFGEGGAGTYSDGKLYTRSLKRGNYIKVLKILVEHGAKSEILYEAHPHIGSNKLPDIVANIRNTIIQKGGEIHFDSQVTHINKNGNEIYSVTTNGGREFKGKAYIFATGHSARDVYTMLHANNISIEAKPFALGVRIEHPQSLIDKIQYKQNPRHPNLPAASYSIVCQVAHRGVFSFCMCPGGLVIPAATAPGEIVVNGMSLSRRDSPFANSGLVTSVETEELQKHGFGGIFGNLEFQALVEKTMFNAGDGSQKAPAQRALDFVNKKISAYLNDSSYIPGLFSAPLHELLPDFITYRLTEALRYFGNKIPGYLTNDANLIGVESRTSAPIKIPRDPVSFQHPQVANLYPCGEGAGYAGGILSAAMDGQNVAKAIAGNLLSIS